MSECNKKTDNSALNTIREEMMLNSLKKEAKDIGADISSCRDNIPCIQQKIDEKKALNNKIHQSIKRTNK